MECVREGSDRVTKKSDATVTQDGLTPPLPAFVAWLTHAAMDMVF